MNQESIFLQRVKHAKGDIDLSLLKECTYIEELDLSGPVLILKFDDKDRIIRDRLCVKASDEIEVFFSDAWTKDKIQHTAKFTIMPMPVQDRILTMNCFHSGLMSLKTPSIQSLLFTNKDVSTILKRCLPGWADIETSSFPVSDDYHVLPGQRPSLMLRKMGREKAATVFFQRKKFMCKRLAEISNQQPTIFFEHRNNQAENSIIAYKSINADPVLDDALCRNYRGWNMNSGWMGGDASDGPDEVHPSPNKNTLSNLKAHIRPVIDFTTHGNGGIMPGVMISIVWNTDLADAPIDESLPPQCIITTAVHHYTPQKYFCRIKGGVFKNG